LSEVVGVSVLEKAIIAIGGLIGAGAGLVFYYVAKHLQLPALLFAIVDVFGVTIGSVIFGLLVAPVAMGAQVLLIDWILPVQQGSQDT
jgi:hypothetical protein